MRIVVPDPTSASGLAERLSAAFGAERISLRSERRELGVRFERSDRTVLQIFDAVERWVDQAGVRSVEMSLGERSYRLVRWSPVEDWQ
jgi:hypothetical protein